MPIYTFDNFQCDSESSELKFKGNSIEIKPKAIEILLFFLNSNRKVKSRTEIMESVYSDTYIADNTLTQQIKSLKKILCESKYGEKFKYTNKAGEEFIKTFPRKGYQFLVPVKVRSSSTFRVNNIPYRPGFVGRVSELEEVCHLVKEKETSRFVFWGMPGVGKTHFSLALIEKLQEELDESKKIKALIHINLEELETSPGINSESKQSTASKAKKIVVELFGEQNVDKMTDSQVNLRFESLVNEHRTLLFLDNASSQNQYETLNNKNCVLIVTSRENLKITGGETKRIEVLTKTDAKELLFSIAKEHLFKNKADVLAKEVGWLPLALKPLAALLDRRLLDIEELIRDLKTKTKPLGLGNLELYDPKRAELTIRAVIALSENFLDEKLKEFWYEMGVFPSNFDIKAAAFVTDSTIKSSKKKLRLLTSKSLADLLELKLIEQLTVERYILHDLIKDYTREKISEISPLLYSELQHKHAQYYVQVLKKMDKYFYAGKQSLGVSLYNLEFANVQSGWRYLNDISLETKENAKLCKNYIDSGRLVTFTQQSPRERIDWHKKLGEVAKLLGDREMEGWSLNAVGEAYRELGEIKEAKTCFRKSLGIFRRIGLDRGECRSLLRLGLIFDTEKFRKRAIVLFKLALKLVPLNKDVKDRTIVEGALLGNLGEAFRKLGKFEEAYQFQQERFKVVKKINDERGMCATLLGIGNIYSDEGSLDKAKETYTKALEFGRKINDLVYLPIILFGRAKVFEKLNQINDAISDGKEAKSLFEIRNNPKSNEVIEWLDKLR